MIPSLRLSLACASLLALGVWAYSSVSGAHGEPSEAITERPQGAPATSNPKTAPAETPPAQRAPAQLSDAPPVASGEAMGSAALEHRLDKLEKDLESSPL